MSFTYGSNARPYDFNVGSLTKDYNQIGLEQYDNTTEPNKPRYYSVTFEKELPEELYKSLELIPITTLQELASKEYENEFYDTIKVHVDPKFMNVELHEFVTNEDGEPELADYEKLTINRFIESVKSGVLIPKGSMVEVENKEIENMENINELESFEPEMVNAELSDEQQNMNLWSNDSWYEMHPEKILGEVYTTKGKYGEAIKVRGTIDALSGIQVPESWGKLGISNNNPLLSVENDTPLSVIENETNAPLVTQIIEQSKKDVVEKVKRKSKKSIEVETKGEESIDSEVLTFEEVYKLYNDDISPDDLECHVWYKTQEGSPLSKRWVNLIRPTYSESEDLRESVEYNVSEDKIKEWLENGTAYWFNRGVVPSYVYLSGDVYEKKRQLTKDKDYIVDNFGIDVYINQETAINQVFSQKDSNRLILKGTTNDGLILVPFSQICKDVKVSTLNSFGEKDKFRLVVSYSRDGKMTINWKASIQNNFNKGNNLRTFDSLNLMDAFCYWVLVFSPPLRKEGITRQEIVKYYVQQSDIRTGAGKGATDKEKEEAKARKSKIQQLSQEEGLRLFADFLYNELDTAKKIEVELLWNEQYNNYVFTNSKKIPVAFTMTKYIGGKPEVLRPEKREAVAFMMNNGSGVLSYDVGVGKTPSAVFTLSSYIDSGYSKRPLLVVPNQVYKQFINEIKSFAPHIKVNGFYNFKSSEALMFVNEENEVIAKPDLYSVSVITYEGFMKLGFKTDTINRLFPTMYEILEQGESSEKEKTKTEEKIRKLMGEGMKGGAILFEDLGFDFLCYDEAHNFKKVFGSVKGEAEEDEDGEMKRNKNPYQISAGDPSSRGVKSFIFNQYVLSQNENRNVMLLTATPFTNSPLEIFGVIASVGYRTLKLQGLNNLKRFFDNYVDLIWEVVITSNLDIGFKQVIKGFKNITSLQTIVRRFILYKTGEDVNVKRPNKVVLPLTKKRVGSAVIPLSNSEKIETFIGMSPIQQEIMDMIVGYVEDGEPNIPFDCIPIWKRTTSTDVKVNPDEDDDAETGSDELNTALETLSMDAIDDEETKKSIRILRGMDFGRAVAMSPYLFPCLPLKSMPTSTQFVENSPKIKYVMDCIKSVKEHHEKMGTPISGQVIYMDRGVELFKLVKEYLIEKVGFKDYEVAIISGGMPKPFNAKGKVNKGSKEYIKNLFNGQIYNEETQLYESISDEQRIKVIIGSSTIKEGINLQKYSTCLYNLYIDWNPTDMQQLEGRIWRQGNTYAGVRIVNPLLVDSTDMFVFQKLEEKTARINSIWEMDGKNSVLKIEDVDANELKYALLRDPKKIAKVRLNDMITKLKDDKVILQNTNKRLGNIISSIQDIQRTYDILLPVAKYFFPKAFSPENLPNNKLEVVQKIINTISKIERNVAENSRLVNEEGIPIFESADWRFREFRDEVAEKREKEWEKKNPKQAEKNKKLNSWDDEYVEPKIKPMIYGEDYLFWNANYDYQNNVIESEKAKLLNFISEENPTFNYSPYIQYYLSSTFSSNGNFARDRRTLGEGNKQILKEKNDLLATLNIDLDFSNTSKITEKRTELQETLKNIDEEITNLQSDEYLANLIQQIIQEIIEKQVPVKPLNESVQDFAKLNFMLDEKKIDSKEEKDAEVVRIENLIINTTENVESAKRMIESVGKPIESVEPTPESEEMSLTDLENLLDGYKDTIEFLSGQDKKDMKILIEALTETIEFLKLA